jgi:hypothetical protein
VIYCFSISPASTMSAETLLTEGTGSDAPKIRAQELDECNTYVENVSPLFDSKRVLLRCIFFINEDYSKYVAVGFYPARDYQVFAEFGVSKERPPLLTEQHVRTFAEHLPRLCNAVCRKGHYSCIDGDFKLVTAGSYRTAKLSLGKQSLFVHYNELRYMVHMFHVIQNQQILCIRALADVITYATAAPSSTEYIEPTTSAHKAVHCPQLYEELKTIM